MEIQDDLAFRTAPAIRTQGPWLFAFGFRFWLLLLL
jgi:hypothetical protein